MNDDQIMKEVRGRLQYVVEEIFVIENLLIKLEEQIKEDKK